MEEKNKKEFAERVQRRNNLDRWRDALKDKKWKHKGNDLSFHVDGMYDREGLRPKIHIIVTDPDGFCEPYATLTHNDSRVKLADDEILVRYDGTSLFGAEAVADCNFFEEQERDDTTLGLAGVWKLVGGLP